MNKCQKLPKDDLNYVINGGLVPDKVIIPHSLTDYERHKVVLLLAEKMGKFCHPEKVVVDNGFKDRVKQRHLECGKLWLHFDELLRCQSINSFGVAACRAHDYFVVEAAKYHHFIHIDPKSRRIYMG